MTAFNEIGQIQIVSTNCANSKGFQIYPPPTTPPEPAPPDHIGTSSMMRQYKSNLVSASQSSLDDITCKPIKHLIFFR